MRKITFLFSILLTSLITNAQYNFSIDTATYQSLSSSTSLNNGFSWTKNSSYTINFGFNFTWYNHTSTTLTVMAGGGLSFPGSGNKQLRVFSHTDSGYLLGDRDSTNSISPIGYKVDGNSGNRILKIQWENAGFREWCASSDTSDFVNFQIWLYEIGNRIEVHFGSFQADSGSYGNPSCNTGSYGPQILLQHDACNSVLGLTGMSNSPAAAYRDHCFWQPGISINGTPESGTIYRFAPIITTLHEEKKETIKIYPNPVKDNVVLTGIPSGFVIDQIVVLDPAGKSHFSMSNVPHPSQELSFSLSGLKQGIYFLKLAGENNQVLLQKIIKTSSQ